MTLDALLAANPLPVFDTNDRTTLWRALNMTHTLVVASERLTEIAAGKATGRLAEFYRRHVEDERDHAPWLAADLARLGHAPVPDHQGTMIAGALYYLLEHDRPSSLLGYMAVLEGRPMPIETVGRIEAIHGPLKALRHHAENDPAHGAEVRAEIAALAGPDLDAAMQSARWTAEALSAAFWRMGLRPAPLRRSA
jgi:hypothetical protein